ncbi:MAG: outer membrane beta-barrel protein [Acidobacteriota bacterium]|nr:outer membrane beta-barrel protein [Acidobacteriota bacterium]
MRTHAIRILIVAGALGLLAAGPARADTFVTPFLGATFGGNAPSSQPSWGVAIGGGGLIGVEGEFGYTPDFFGSGGNVSASHVITLMGNLFVAAPAGPVRPYVTAGMGLIRQHTELSTAGLLTNITSDDFGIDAGGGARFMLTPHVAIRGDLRYFKVRKSGGLGFWRGYGGLALSF